MAYADNRIVRTINPRVDGTPFELQYTDDHTSAAVLQYTRIPGAGYAEVEVGFVHYQKSRNVWTAVVRTRSGLQTLDNLYRNEFAAARALRDFRAAPNREIVSHEVIELPDSPELLHNAIDGAEKRESKREDGVKSRAEKRAERAAAHRAYLKTLETADTESAPALAAD